MGQNDFYTMKGYERQSNADMSAAMEDYLEMIFRMTAKGDTVRVSALASLLHVKPPSVSKMVEQLALAGYLTAEKYGRIALTEAGRAAGGYLLYRHETVHRFLCLINHSENELEQTEKIEHFLNGKTVENMNRFVRDAETRQAPGKQGL